NAGGVKATITAAGKSRWGDAGVPTVSLEAANGFAVAAGESTFANNVILTANKTIKQEVSATVDIWQLGTTLLSSRYLRRLRVANYDLDYTSALFNASATTDSTNILNLPASARIVALKIELRVPFAGPSLTSMTVSIGDAGDPDGLLTVAGQNMVTDAQWAEYKTLGDYYAAFTEGVTGMTRAARQLVAYSTSVGCNMDDLTAGRVLINVLYEQSG
ncbi:hypothetical protein KKE60_08765, partial [Patescibacteria group bacterium]|nr:hypothetical protein [Patescibacteria group bacterium]